MDTFTAKDYQELKLKLTGYTKPDQPLFRNVLFDRLFASMPKDPQAKVQIYNAEIAPGGRFMPTVTTRLMAATD